MFLDIAIRLKYLHALRLWVFAVDILTLQFPMSFPGVLAH